MSTTAFHRNPAASGFLFLFIFVFLFFSITGHADPVDDALKRATAFLLQQQDETGAIWERVRHIRKQTAMSSLAVLSLQRLGHLPADNTPEGRASRRALDYVLDSEAQDPAGYFGLHDGSRMYGHGIATWMLAEMSNSGATPEQTKRIVAACRRAVDLILNAQQLQKKDMFNGGWRYVPDSLDSDLSVTLWQVIALDAAKRAGLTIPQSAFDNAATFILRCYAPAGPRASTRAGFGYQASGREFSTTAEGLLALLLCRQGRVSPEIQLTSERVQQEGINTDQRWYYYVTFSYSRAALRLDPAYAAKARATVAEALLPLQAKAGSWDAHRGEERQAGKLYATTMAILSLAK